MDTLHTWIHCIHGYIAPGTQEVLRRSHKDKMETQTVTQTQQACNDSYAVALNKQYWVTGLRSHHVMTVSVCWQDGTKSDASLLTAVCFWPHSEIQMQHFVSTLLRGTALRSCVKSVKLPSDTLSTVHLHGTEPSTSSASQQIPRKLWKQRVQRVNNSPPLVPILSQINPVHASPSRFPMIIQTVSSNLRTGISICLQQVSTPNTCMYFPTPPIRHMPYQSHLPWSDNLTSIPWTAPIMKSHFLSLKTALV
jgi:hypothetical protein